MTAHVVRETLALAVHKIITDIIDEIDGLLANLGIDEEKRSGVMELRSFRKKLLTPAVTNAAAEAKEAVHNVQQELEELCKRKWRRMKVLYSKPIRR